jgi:hypothetical protein
VDVESFELHKEEGGMFPEDSLKIISFIQEQSALRDLLLQLKSKKKTLFLTTNYHSKFVDMSLKKSLG